MTFADRTLPGSSRDATSGRAASDIFLAVAGLAQLAASFTPAAHVRLRGWIPFVRLPNAGLAFVVLAAITVLLALVPRGWWRLLPALASAALSAVVYARLRWQPSGGFADPLLRHLVRPAWGFVPMVAAIALALVVGLASAIWQRARTPAGNTARVVAE